MRFYGKSAKESVKFILPIQIGAQLSARICKFNQFQWTVWILEPFENFEFCQVCKIFKTRKIADVRRDFTENRQRKV